MCLNGSEFNYVNNIIKLTATGCGRFLANRVAAYIERYQDLCIAVWAWFQSRLAHAEAPQSASGIAR